MGEPIVFISRSSVKEGKVEALEDAIRRAASSIERDKQMMQGSRRIRASR